MLTDYRLRDIIGNIFANLRGCDLIVLKMTCRAMRHAIDKHIAEISMPRDAYGGYHFFEWSANSWFFVDRSINGDRSNHDTTKKMLEWARDNGFAANYLAALTKPYMLEPGMHRVVIAENIGLYHPRSFEKAYTADVSLETFTRFMDNMMLNEIEYDESLVLTILKRGRANRASATEIIRHYITHHPPPTVERNHHINVLSRTIAMYGYRDLYLWIIAKYPDVVVSNVYLWTGNMQDLIPGRSPPEALEPLVNKATIETFIEAVKAGISIHIGLITMKHFSPEHIKALRKYKYRAHLGNYIYIPVDSYVYDPDGTDDIYWGDNAIRTVISSGRDNFDLADYLLGLGYRWPRKVYNLTPAAVRWFDAHGIPIPPNRN